MGLTEDSKGNEAFRGSSLLSLFAPVKSGCHLLDFRGRHRAEEYPHRLFSPDHAHQLVYHAIHGNKDEENDLDGPEMRPDDFGQQLLIAGNKAARLAPEIDQAFQ